MEDNIFTIQVINAKGNITLQLTENTTLKEMAEKYSKEIGEPFDNFGKNIFFIYNEKKLENFSKQICYIFNPYDSVYILDENEPIKKTNRDIRKEINKRQKDRRNGLEKSNDLISEALGDMAVLGCIEKNQIEKDIKEKPNNFISINECLNSEDEQFFILGILAQYLENNGITPVIESQARVGNEEEETNAGTVLQFICNGYILKDKYILDFELRNTRVKQLYENKDELNKFIKNFKEKMSKIFKLNKEDLIVTEFQKNEGLFTLILIFKSDVEVRELTKDKLVSEFTKERDLKKLKTITKEKIMESIRLNQLILDKRGNNKSDDNWGYDETRGGEVYYPPVGWHRYGLKVWDQYDKGNNDWLSYDNRKGEWCIAYSGLSNIAYKNNKIYGKDKDLKHSGKTVGSGVYIYHKSNVMKENTEVISIKGINYKMGLMLRVKPEAIRIPESNKNIWAVNGIPEEIRPYGILLQKV